MTQAINAARVRETIEAVMTDWNVPGLAVLLVQGDEVLFQEGFGVREAGKPELVDPETVFRIGSCSKAFTAGAVGILVDEGKLGWDDPVIQHLPHFRLSDPYLTTLVTVRDLLAHRVSVDSFCYDETYQVLISRDDVVRLVQDDAPIPAFRGQFAYSDMLYVVAGQLIPAVTGMSWDAFLQERVFAPLGMSSASTTGNALAATANHATPHYDDAGQRRPFPIPLLGPHDVEVYGPPGGVNVSLVDMLPWLRLHMGGAGAVDGVRLFSEHTAKELHTAQMLARRPAQDGPAAEAYGLGWFLDWHRGQRFVQHSGHYWAYTSAVGFLPERQLGFFVTCNVTLSGMPLALGQTLLDHLLGLEPGDWLAKRLARAKDEQAAEDRRWREAVAARVGGTQPTLPLDGYAGRYQSRPWDQWDVGVQDGQLRLTRVNTLSPFYADLEHWHHDTFLVHWNQPDPSDYQPAKLVTFRLSSENKPYGMDFYHGSYSYYYRQLGPNQPNRELRLVSATE